MEKEEKTKPAGASKVEKPAAAEPETPTKPAPFAGVVTFLDQTPNQVVLKQAGCEGKTIAVFVDGKPYGKATAVDETVIVQGAPLKISGHTFSWEVE